VADVERELDRLYGLPLSDFTAARNELARTLKKEGDPEGAAEVGALKKPAVSAWALNQLARRSAPLVRQFLQAGDKLREAQASAAGGGRAEELRAAIAAERAALREVVDAARSLEDERGRRLSDAVVDRIRNSLTAVAGNEQARTLLERGQATEDFDQSGFAGLSAIALGSRAPAPAKASPKGGDELAERRQRRDERRQRIQALRARLRELRQEASASRREAGRVERAAAAARSEAERIEREHLQAVRDADELDAEVERAAAELAEAERS